MHRIFFIDFLWKKIEAALHELSKCSWLINNTYVAFLRSVRCLFNTSLTLCTLIYTFMLASEVCKRKGNGKDRSLSLKFCLYMYIKVQLNYFLATIVQKYDEFLEFLFEPSGKIATKSFGTLKKNYLNT